MFLQLSKYLSDRFHIFFSLILNVDKNVIEVHNNKVVERFCQDLVDITLKYSQGIGQAKKYDLVLEVAISDFKNHLLFVTFSNPHSIVGIG